MTSFDLQTLPPARPQVLTLESPIDDALIDEFAAAKRGRQPALPVSATRLPDNAQPGHLAPARPTAIAPQLSEQGRDYRQKLLTFRAELARYTDEPFRPVDLTGERVNWVLERRLDPRTGAPIRATSRNAYRRVLGSFVAWLHETGRLTVSVRLGGRDFPVLEHPPVVFTRAQVREIFAYLATHDSVMNRRLTALLAVSLDGGARRGDALSLRLGGIHAATRTVTLVGKFGKERQVPLGPTAWQALLRYRAVRPASETDHVFLRADGGPASGREVSAQFRRLLVRLGMVAPGARGSDGLGIQALRRTFATSYTRSGRSDDQLAAMMGWSADYAHQVRRRYTAVTVEDLAAVHEASSPLEQCLQAA